jgi:acyl carrier protein
VSGKIDRYAAGSVASTASAAGPVIDGVLAEAWATVLGRAEVGPDDDFFALGGDSLAAAKVIARLAERLGARISMDVFLERPVFHEMQEYLEKL